MDGGDSGTDTATGVICTPSFCCIQLLQEISTEQSEASKLSALDSGT